MISNGLFKWTVVTVAALWIALLMVGCGTDPTPTSTPEPTPTPTEEPTPTPTEEPTGPFTFEYTFDSGDEGWTGDFADLPTSDTDFYELVFERRELPDYLAEGEYGLYLSGQNASDDLFMFIKRKLEGLQPNTTYDVRFFVEIATKAPSGAVGIGGPPGESVYLKAGASTEEPIPVPDEDNRFYRLNVDKGNQAGGGSDAIVLGHIGSSFTDPGNETYEFKEFENTDQAFEVTTDDEGVCWVFFGTDSGFEGTSSLYYTNVQVDLEAK